ncbi:MAG: hypothetical protein KA371_20695 [Acidobacteria bacterium]|nr:hypothetical protein [Acidobacteriota bacterium]
MTRPAGAPSPAARAKTARAVGMAMLGSAIAMATLAALAYARVLPFDEAVRGWVVAGVALAAVLDGAIGYYFLRAASQS